MQEDVIEIVLAHKSVLRSFCDSHMQQRKKTIKINLKLTLIAIVMTWPQLKLRKCKICNHDSCSVSRVSYIV